MRIERGIEMGIPTDIHAVLHERGTQYGDFKVMAELAQELKGALRVNASSRLAPYQWESLDLICTKLARIVVGNPYHEDSWTDIAGYAKLVADQLQRAGDETVETSSNDYRRMLEAEAAFAECFEKDPINHKGEAK